MKRTLDLLIGNLWEVRPERIASLRQNYQLLAAPLNSLHQNPTSIEAVQPLLLAAPKLPANTRQAIPTPLATPLPAAVVNIPAPAMPQNVPAVKSNEGGIASVAPDNELITDWPTLVHQVSTCQNCKLSAARRSVVIERGNRHAAWMFIGEGPGEQEDIQGLPFVGASGQLLDKMIAAMSLDRDKEVYIANVIKCRPPHNRNPEEDEITACSNYLYSQIALVRPKIIITLGRFAAQSLLNTDLAIGKLRGTVHYYQQTPLIVTYHPSYLLRTPGAKKDSWADLQLAMQTFSK